jgi:hypothetical protein
MANTALAIAVLTHATVSHSPARGNTSGQGVGGGVYIFDKAVLDYDATT